MSPADPALLGTIHPAHAISLFTETNAAIGNFGCPAGTEISVQDSGIGIAPEDQARVFEEFEQTGSGQREEASTGLGLTLAKRFVELHGGRIWVESAIGKGTLFRFTLALAAPAVLAADREGGSALAADSTAR